MKHILSFIIAVLINIEMQAQSIDTVGYFRTRDFTISEGKSIDSLIASIPYPMVTINDAVGTTRNVSGLSIRFSSTIRLEIAIRSFRFADPSVRPGDITLLREENVAWIKVWKGACLINVSRAEWNDIVQRHLDWECERQ